MKELLPTDPFTSRGAVEQFRRESAMRCDPIDARISTLDAEFDELSQEFESIKNIEVDGFFARLRARCKIHELSKRMNLNRDLLSILYRKRIANS